MLPELPDGYCYYGGRARIHVARWMGCLDDMPDTTLCGQPCLPRFGGHGISERCVSCARALARIRAMPPVRP